MRSAVEHLLITAHAHAHPLIKPLLIGTRRRLGVNLGSVHRASSGKYANIV